MLGLGVVLFWSILMLIVVWSQKLAADFGEDNESFEMKYAWPFRAAPVPTLVLAVFFAIGVFQTPDPVASILCFGGSAVAGSATVMFYLYYSSSRLIVTVDSLTWISWFGFQTTIRWDQIRRISSKNRLLCFVIDGSDGSQIVVPAYLNGMRQLSEAIERLVSEDRRRDAALGFELCGYWY
ncbi:MAG: PH domain-containing protein [Planctomycetota bacterium]